MRILKNIVFFLLLELKKTSSYQFYMNYDNYNDSERNYYSTYKNIYSIFNDLFQKFNNFNFDHIKNEDIRELTKQNLQLKLISIFIDFFYSIENDHSNIQELNQYFSYDNDYNDNDYNDIENIINNLFEKYSEKKLTGRITNYQINLIEESIKNSFSQYCNLQTLNLNLNKTIKNLYKLIELNDRLISNIKNMVRIKNKINENDHQKLQKDDHQKLQKDDHQKLQKELNDDQNCFNNNMQKKKEIINDNIDMNHNECLFHALKDFSKQKYNILSEKTILSEKIYSDSESNSSSEDSDLNLSSQDSDLNSSSEHSDLNLSLNQNAVSNSNQQQSNNQNQNSSSEHSDLNLSLNQNAVSNSNQQQSNNQNQNLSSQNSDLKLSLNQNAVSNSNQQQSNNQNQNLSSQNSDLNLSLNQNENIKNHIKNFFIKNKKILYVSLIFFCLSLFILLINTFINKSNNTANTENNINLEEITQIQKIL